MEVGDLKAKSLDARRVFRRRRTGWIALCAGAAVAVALVAALALFTSVARANYLVRECVPAQGVGAPDAQPTVSGGPKIYQSNECTGGARAGWGLGLESNGAANEGQWKGWFFGAPPHTHFATVKAYVHEYAAYGYGGVYQGGSDPAHYFHQGQVFDWFPIDNTTSYHVFLRCFASGGCSSPGGAGDTNVDAAFAFLTDFTADVVDEVAPSLTASGDLLSGQVVRGNQPLQVHLSDLGGGVQSVLVRVNGVASAQTPDLCGVNTSVGAYTTLKPCPNDWSGTVWLDTEHGAGWSNGPNDVLICGWDVGGNQSTCIRRTVQVDNSCPGSGGTAASSISSGVDVGGELRSRAGITSNDQPVIRGSLKDGSGAPVAGATVCVYETVDLPDASRELATTVTTQGNGRFATRLDTGPSRKLDLVYRYNDRVLSDAAELDSTVVPTLRMPKKHVHNGSSAVFLGHLPGPNSEGRVVALQARVGRKWRTFKQLRTGQDGEFHGTYRFTQTFGVVQYTFRALVKRQSGYPYEPGASRHRKVTVHG